MPYNTKELLVDHNGNPIPQRFDNLLDDFVPDTPELDRDIKAELQSIKAKLIASPATESTLEAIENLLNDGISISDEDVLTELEGVKAELESIKAKMLLAPATEAKQDALNAIVGEVQASPTANTLLARLKALETQLTSLEGKVDTIIDGTTPANVQVTGSNIEIDNKTYRILDSNLLVGKASNKPDPILAMNVVGGGVMYWAYDIDPSMEYLEVSTGLDWVVME